MASFKIKCVECGKEFESYNISYTLYCSVGCQMKKFEEHPPECPWHFDWHKCNCGAFDGLENNNGKPTGKTI
jgi:hypothetical protein